MLKQTQDNFAHIHQLVNSKRFTYFSIYFSLVKLPKLQILLFLTNYKNQKSE
jgi:hypothetical protein